MCADRDARLVHVSTDCVFSGERGGYLEDDLPDARDLYGRSKLLGEVVDAPNAVTLRTSIVGRELQGALGLFEWFLSQRGGRVRGFSRAIFSGVTTAVLAELIGDLIERARAALGAVAGERRADRQAHPAASRCATRWGSRWRSSPTTRL